MRKTRSRRYRAGAEPARAGPSRICAAAVRDFATGCGTALEAGAAADGTLDGPLCEGRFGAETVQQPVPQAVPATDRSVVVLAFVASRQQA